MSRKFLPTLLLLLIALCAFVAAYQPRQTFTVDLAAGDAERWFDNFHAAERGYRWTQARSAVWLSGLGGGNLRWTVGLQLSGSRPPGAPMPRVKLRVNGRPLAEFVAGAEERVYEFALEPGQLGLNGDLLLEIESDVFTPANDPRELGVRLFRVWAAPSDGFALPSLKALGMALGIALAIAFVFGMGWKGAFDGRDFLSSFLVSLTLVLFFCAWAVGGSRLDAVWWMVIAGLSIIGLAVLVVAIAVIAPRAASSGSARDRLNTRQRWMMLALFGGAALVRLALDTGRGYEGDVAIYLSLAWKTVTYGIHSAYLNVGDVPPPNTPPFLLYPFWVIGWLYQQCFSPLFPPPWLGDPPLLRFMMRMPGLFADLLTGAFILRAVIELGNRKSALEGEEQNTTSDRENFGLWLSGAYLYNPALIFDSAYWGQTAAIHTFWMLLAVIAASRKKMGWAGAALCLAVATKPQAVALAPLVVLLAWREGGFLRFAGTAVATWLLVYAPFLAIGNLESALRQYAQTTQYHPYISVNAHNFWWLVTGGQGWQSDALSFAFVSYRLAGFVLFGGATLLSLAVVWRNRSALHLTAAYQSLAFFMLLTQIHENHHLPLFAPLVLACALNRRLWIVYGALSLTALANMALHDPNIVMALGYPAKEIYGGPALALPRWINALIQAALFGVLTAHVIAARRA